MVKRNNSAPTMKDVAKLAGVSLGTVSKVINGISVGKDYRERVESAAKALGYTVNSYARGLKTNRTYCVALVLPSLRHPFFASLADEVAACLKERGYRCILMITNFDAAVERESFILVRQNKADGVIALTYSPDIDVDPSLPVVAIDRRFAPGLPCVSSDNYGGGRLAAETLLSLGCRRPLLLHIGADVSGEPHRRGSGFLDGCAAHGVDCASVVLRESETEAGFYRYLDAHTAGGRADFDGVFCSSDGLAVRVRSYLAERGVNVPEDVQIIGFDGVVNYATGRYDCSTIVQPVAEMARTAVELLLSGEHSAAGQDIRLSVRYASCGTTKDQ